MLEALQRALSIPELKKRILFVLMMFLVYAIGAHIPVPGVDHQKLEALFNRRGHAFVVVGAAHLVGADGLIAMLRAKGYTVEQM